RDDGTLWLNLGDSYANTKVGNTNGTYGKVKQKAGVNDDTRIRTIPSGLKQKDLIGIPWRLALPSLAIASILLVNPERFKHEGELCMECAGDEFVENGIDGDM